MKYKFKKIDAIIVVIMVVIAGFVLIKYGYIDPNPDEPELPDIEFAKDEENRLLTVRSVSDKVFWSDISIEGDCDKSILGGYIKEGDQITNCVGTIVIMHKPTDTLLYTYKFEPIPELPSNPLIPGNMRDVSPQDEGVHFNTILTLNN